MSLQCLFTADDFALNRSCSEAIIEAIAQGRLQATSVLAGGEDQANFKRLSDAKPMFINVHLNLLEGKALTSGGAAFDITTKDNFFCLTLGELIKKLMFSPKRDGLKQWILAEFCQQIEFVYGYFPQYEMRLDGHLHIHILPPLRDVMANILKKYPINYVRIPSELKYDRNIGAFEKIKGNLRRFLLRFWAQGLRQLIDRNHISTSDYFLGAQASCQLTLDDLDIGLEAITQLNKASDPIIEVMTHPVTNDVDDKLFYKDSRYSAAHVTDQRKNELNLLLSDDIVRILQKNHAIFFAKNN